MAQDPCPYCGKEFDHDNAGARQNHVDSCREEAEKFVKAATGGAGAAEAAAGAAAAADAQAGGQIQPRQNARGQGGGGDVPATVEEAAAGVPAVTGGGVEAGRQLAKLRNAEPEEEAQIKGTLIQQFGSLLTGYGEEYTQQELESIERARGGGTAQASDQWVECGICERSIQKVPVEPGQEFECPHCRGIIVAP